MTDYGGAQGPGVMMNNFAGPSDTQNFAEPHYIEDDDDLDSETPFMGNHVVKTVRNLRLR